MNVDARPGFIDCPTTPIPNLVRTEGQQGRQAFRNKVRLPEKRLPKRVTGMPSRNAHVRREAGSDRCSSNHMLQEPNAIKLADQLNSSVFVACRSSTNYVSHDSGSRSSAFLCKLCLSSWVAWGVVTINEQRSERRTMSQLPRHTQLQ